MLIRSKFESDSNLLQLPVALLHTLSWICVGVVSVALPTLTAEAQSLRVVTYNINQDTGDFGTNGVPSADLTTVLQGIGITHLAGNAQPIDVLAVQELYATPSTTL